MKLIRFSLVTLTVWSLAISFSSAQSTSPSIPVGNLTAFPTVVQTGTKPTLTWNISYPSVVENFVTVRRTPEYITLNQTTTPPPGTTPPTITTTGPLITLRENLICDIRILGAGVTTQNSNGSINFIRTAGVIAYNGSSTWNTIFDGKNTDSVVQQQGIIKTVNATANQSFDFGGKYYWNNAWSTLRHSKSGVHVQALVNGDIPPSKIPDYNAPSLESFIRPYLDASGRVKIGPMDVIIFMELTHTDESNVGYDLQDLVFLVTFRKS